MIAGRTSIDQALSQVRSSHTGAPELGSGSPGATAITHVRDDFDGDGKSDYAVFVPATAQWVIHNSSNGSSTAFVWGDTGAHDTPMSGDFNGDGRSDAVAYDPTTSIWSIRNSADGSATAVVWGIAGSADVPLVADFAIYRNSDLLRLIKNSVDGTVTGTYMNPTLANFGPGIPAPLDGDANGDGKADASVFAPASGMYEGIFETRLSNGSEYFHNLMGADWSLVIGDFNGDGLEDPAHYNPATSRWTAPPYSTPTFIPTFVWGQAGSADFPLIRTGVRVPAAPTAAFHLGG